MGKQTYSSMKNKILLSIIVIFIIVVMFLKNMLINIWHLNTEKSYFIPKESSLLTFKPTRMNDGSGDWWLYGEDKTNYYALNIENKNPQYFKLEKGNETKNFEKFNYHTWNVK